MKKSSAAVVVLALLVCIGLGAYIATRQQPPVPPPVPPSPPEPAPPMKIVKIYQVTVVDNRAELEPVEVKVPGDKSIIEGAINQLIEHEGSSQIGNPIPEGTRLLSLKVEKGIAKVDFSREFADNFAGGSEAESLMVSSILTTLGQFPEVKKALIMVEGKPLETLGHLDLSEPMNVIRQ